MSHANGAFDVEEGLLGLPGDPDRWIWAFTCPEPRCACRAAVVVSTDGDRESVRQVGRSVAEAWSGTGHHGEAAAELKGAVAFALDLHSLEIFPPVGAQRLALAEHPEVKAITDRLDDEVLDAIARLWHRGKGEAPPPAPGDGGGNIPIEGWRPGDPVLWDDAQPFVRGDTYILGERVFEAIELYCVERGCECCDAVVDFGAVAPRGTPEPGHVEIYGGVVTLYPAHERHRDRLTELWDAYCQRHPHYQARIARRSAAMHGLAGRIVPAPAKAKVDRNGPCPCGSGRKYKKCCGAA